MKESEDDIEDLFRERFSDDEAPVSPRVWNAVKQSLPSEGNTLSGGIAKNIFSALLKKKFLLLFIGAAVAGGGGVWLVSEMNKRNEQILITKTSLQTAENNTLENESTITSTLTDHNQNSNQDQSLSDRQQQEELKKQNGILTQSNSENNPEEISGTSGERKDSKNQQEKTGNVSSRKLTNSETPDVTKNSSTKNESTFSSSGNSKNSKEINRKKNANVQTRSAKKETYSDKPAVSQQEKENVNPNGIQTVQQSDTKNGLPAIASSTTQDDKEKGSPTTGDKQPIPSNAQPLPQNSQTILDKNESSKIHDLAHDSLSELTKAKEEKQNHLATDDRNVVPNNFEEAHQNKNNVGNSNQKENIKTENATQYSLNATSGEDEKPFTLKDSTAGQPFAKGIPTNETKQINGPADTLLKSTVVMQKDSILPVADTLQTKTIDSTSIAKDTTGKKQSDKSTKLSRWSVDLVVAPMYTGASTKATDASFEERVKNKNTQDKNQLTLSFGATVNYTIHPRWYVSAGMFYSAYSEKYDFKNTFSDDSIGYSSHTKMDTTFRDSSGFQLIDTIQEITVQDSTRYPFSQEYKAKKKDQYSFISFPVSVSVYLVKKEN